MSQPPLWPFACSLALLLAFGALPAAAQVPVAVMAFEGENPDAARARVIDVITADARAQPVDPAAVDAAVAGLSVGTTLEQRYRDLMAAVQARMVIEGSVEGRGRRGRLTLTARGPTGAVIATSNGVMRRSALRRTVQQLLNQALPQIPDLPPEAAAEVAPEVVDEAANDWIDDEVPVSPEERERRELEQQAARSWSPEHRSPIVDAQLTYVARNRDLSVSRTDLSAMTLSCCGTFFSQLGARLTVRPLAWLDRWAAGLYATGSFAYIVGFRGVNTGTETLPVEFFQLSAAAGYMAPVAEDLIDVGLELGGGLDTYNIADGATTQRDSAEYPYFRAAVRGRVRFYRQIIGADVDFGVRPAFGRGELSVRGSGDTIGIDVGGGVSGGYPLVDMFGITYAARVSYVHYFLSFPAGSGNESAIQIMVDAGVGIW